MTHKIIEARQYDACFVLTFRYKNEKTRYEVALDDDGEVAFTPETQLDADSEMDEIVMERMCTEFAEQAIPLFTE